MADIPVINDKIEAGELKLQSFSHPPLVAGEYALNTKLTVKATNITTGNVFENHSLHFTVSAPRFIIEDALVHSVYPLPGSTGAYHATLPHMVFTRKTLPWERTIDDIEDKKPWLALLLVTEDEMQNNHISISEKEVEQILDTNGNRNLIVPSITLEVWEKNKSKVKTIEMPLPFFRNIAPLAVELDFLAHTRQVDTGNKENSDSNPKGWYSCIIANRLPQQAIVNHVFLVSLEGHGEVINKNMYPETDKLIRLVVLHQCSFTEAGSTFDELIDNLEKNIKPLRINLSAEEETKISKAAANAFRYGYVPLNTETRKGERTVSWYRGPLAPVDIASPEQYHYENADQALRFDKDSGLFDVSYAAAWQLGRLLALQNNGFTTALSNWKASYKTEWPLQIARNILKQDLPDGTAGIDPDSMESLVHDAVSDELLEDYLLELWMLQKNTI